MQERARELFVANPAVGRKALFVAAQQVLPAALHKRPYYQTINKFWAALERKRYVVTLLSAHQPPQAEIIKLVLEALKDPQVQDAFGALIKRFQQQPLEAPDKSRGGR